MTLFIQKSIFSNTDKNPEEIVGSKEPKHRS